MPSPLRSTRARRAHIGLILAAGLLLGAAPRSTANPAPGMPDPPQDNHEYAPLRRVPLVLRDFTLRRIDGPGAGGPPVNLSRFARGRRLVLLAYFAPWCPNWRYQAPGLADLYARYHARGLEILAISEYANPADTRAFFASLGPAPYPVVVESESRDDRERTGHYALRQLAADSRKWGSPFLVFFTPGAKGADPVAKEAWVVTGELMRDQIESFLQARLGRPARLPKF